MPVQAAFGGRTALVACPADTSRRTPPPQRLHRGCLGSGIAVFTIASAACAISTNVEFLIGARMAKDVGGGTAVPLALITDVTPSQAHGKALGIWGAFTGMAVATGPLVGGAVVDGLSWQWIFWLNVPVGVAAGLIRGNAAGWTSLWVLAGLIGGGRRKRGPGPHLAFHVGPGPPTNTTSVVSTLGGKVPARPILPPRRSVPRGRTGTCSS